MLQQLQQPEPALHCAATPVSIIIIDNILEANRSSSGSRLP